MANTMANTMANVWTMVDGSQVTRISCAETAKLVRVALKKAFPAVAFTVTSKTYSGGASITVGWTDGPTAAAVEVITSAFSGATFDGMIDLKEYKAPTTINGQRVSFGADYIHTSRNLSAAFLTTCAERMGHLYGTPVPEVRESVWTHKGKTTRHAWIERNSSMRLNDFDCVTVADKALQLAYTTSAD